MDSKTLFEQFCQAARLDSDASANPDALIGVFQSFRPDGIGLESAFEGLDEANELQERLSDLYRECGDSLRPQGGRDAYFVVRRPRPIDPSVAESATREWLENLAILARAADNAHAAEYLSRDLRIRVLEGIAPKHPRAIEEKCTLLQVFENHVPELLDEMGHTTPTIDLLRPAYYFIACDASLRDYLMWPLYRTVLSKTQGKGSSAQGLISADPYAPYFKLWSHGIKYRIFTDEQIDLYLPRNIGG